MSLKMLLYEVPAGSTRLILGFVSVENATILLQKASRRLERPVSILTIPASRLVRILVFKFVPRDTWQPAGRIYHRFLHSSQRSVR